MVIARVEVEYLDWDTPNFIKIRQPVGKRQDGINLELQGVSITSADPEVLSMMCDKFRADIFAKAGKPDPKD
jgi:hypothetical protein